MGGKRWTEDRIEQFRTDWNAGMLASLLRDKYGVHTPAQTVVKFRRLGYAFGYRHIQARSTRARWLARHAKRRSE